jgi:hypothetical protein
MKTSLKSKIQLAAYQMFRDWSFYASKIHTEIDFTILDETELVNDLTKSIKSAVNSLKKAEKKEKRTLKGYDISFIYGFVNSNLNIHWIHEYIHKRKDDYITLIMLKAIKIYLNFDENALLKIGNIYKNIYTEDLNFEYIDPKLNYKEIVELGSELKINFDAKFDNNIIVSLENLITEKVENILREDAVQFLPDTEKYFSAEDIELFISEF